MTSEKVNTRLRYSAATKAQVLAECREPGMSVAKVAMAHGINTNIVHRWRQMARGGGKAQPLGGTGEFIALPLTAMAAPDNAPADIRVELRRGALTMSVSWPAGAAMDFVAWTRELLR